MKQPIDKWENHSVKKCMKLSRSFLSSELDVSCSFYGVVSSKHYTLRKLDNIWNLKIPRWKKEKHQHKPAILGFQPLVFRDASTFSIRFELRSSMKNVYGLLQIAAWGNKNWGRILGKYSGKFTTRSFLRPDSALVTVVSVAFDCVHMYTYIFIYVCPIKYIFKYISYKLNQIIFFSEYAMDSRHPCQIYPWSKLPLASKRMCSSEKRLLKGKQDTLLEISFMDEMGLTNIFLKMELWNWSSRRNGWCLSTTIRWPFC